MKGKYLVCEDCTSLDEQLLKKCPRCGDRFCPHNSSDLDFNHCYHCFTNFSVTISNICRETRRINPSTGKEVIIHVKMGIKYEIEGSDWLYASQKIKDFANDPDGDMKFTKMVETYRNLYDMMLNYREDVRQAKLDKARADKSSPIKLSTTNGTDKVISSSIHSPEAAARKKVIALLKPLLGREPTDVEIAASIKALGITI